jgi:Flp pilus assembly protein TadD
MVTDASTAEEHRLRAISLEQRGRYEEAAAAYGEALLLEPDDPATHLKLGLVLRGIGRDEEANHEFRRSLDLRGRDEATAGDDGPQRRLIG